jgi:[ribosomal protein S18]-alanine N-acetyltransferase
MSTKPNPALNPPAPSDQRLYADACRAMRASDLNAVLALEQSAHAHPWSLGNFADSLQSGYGAAVYLAAPTPMTPAHHRLGEHALVGYWVAMPGFEETHLLNITVATAFRRQGWAQRMMVDLVHWSGHLRAAAIWLEVRQSNTGAQALYEQAGFERISVRKGYYPLHARAREDAIVMRLNLGTASLAPAQG